MPDSPYALLLSGLLLLISIGCFLIALLGSSHARDRRHRRKRATAQRVSAALAAISNPGQQLAYLRKIDPYVFEELVLDAFEHQGYQVLRSQRYSGDGGVDGVVIKNGRRHLIQAKRYRGHIQLAHIKQFQSVVAQQQCHGLFIHTGRTGKQSREQANTSPNLHILSGRRLLDLLVPAPGKHQDQPALASSGSALSYVSVKAP